MIDLSDTRPAMQVQIRAITAIQTMMVQAAPATRRKSSICTVAFHEHTRALTAAISHESALATSCVATALGGPSYLKDTLCELLAI